MKNCRIYALLAFLSVTVITATSWADITLTNSLDAGFNSLITDMTSVSGTNAGQLDDVRVSPATSFISFNTNLPEWRYGANASDVDSGVGILLFERVIPQDQPEFFVLGASQKLDIGFVGAENADLDELGIALRDINLDPGGSLFANTQLETSSLHSPMDRDPGAPIDVDSDTVAEHYNPQDLIDGSATGGAQSANSHQLLYRYDRNVKVPYSGFSATDTIAVMDGISQAVVTLWHRDITTGGTLKYLDDSDTFNLFKIKDEEMYLLGIDDRSPSLFDADDGLFVIRVSGDPVTPESSTLIPMISLIGLFLLYGQIRRKQRALFTLGKLAKCNKGDNSVTCKYTP